MSAKHWAVIGTCLVSIGAMGSALPTWDAALQPAFVFGALAAIGSVLGGVFTEKPR